MAAIVTERQKEEIHSLFHMLDTDNDGKIGMQEVATLLRALGQNPTPAELKQIEETNQTDVDCKSVVALIENIGLKSLEEEEEELRIAFRAVDRDNSGTISKAELKCYLGMVGEPMSDQEIDELMEISDVNKDGVIDYNEFITVMAAHIM